MDDDQDLLFNKHEVIFSVRVAGVLIRDGKVLLQHPVNDSSYAFPGGHVNFLEASEDALVREYKEETAADVRPVRMLWLAENFFPWGEKFCHQLCFYYLIELLDETQIPLDRSFFVQDEAGREKNGIQFCWIEIAALDQFEVYPVNAKEKLQNLAGVIEKFVYIQK